MDALPRAGTQQPAQAETQMAKSCFLSDCRSTAGLWRCLLCKLFIAYGTKAKSMACYARFLPSYTHSKVYPNFLQHTHRFPTSGPRLVTPAPAHVLLVLPKAKANPISSQYLVALTPALTGPWMHYNLYPFDLQLDVVVVHSYL